MLPGPVIGGQTYRIPPFSTAEWEEKRAFFDEKTGRVWPNAELSARAKVTREFVLKQFWLSFVGDKFDLDSVIQIGSEDGRKRKENKNTGLGQDLQRACGFSQKLLCAAGKTTCKTAQSSNSGLSWKLSIGCATMPLMRTRGCRGCRR